MSRNIFGSLAAALLGTLFAAGNTHANDLWSWNAAQDAQFFNWAAVGSMHVARQIPNHVGSAEILGHMRPVSTEAVYGPTNAYFHELQRRQFGAVDNYGYGAIRNDVPYVNPTDGSGYMFRYGPEGYHRDAAGWIYEGVHPTDFNNNFYPAWNW